MLLDDDEVDEPKPSKKPRLDSRSKGDGIQKIHALAFCSAKIVKTSDLSTSTTTTSIDSHTQDTCFGAITTTSQPHTTVQVQNKIEISAIADSGQDHSNVEISQKKQLEPTEPLVEKKKLVQSTLTSFFKPKK